jgi:hypothetical protein
LEPTTEPSTNLSEPEPISAVPTGSETAQQSRSDHALEM